MHSHVIRYKYALLSSVLWLTSIAVAQTQPVGLQQQVTPPFQFIAYGDTRFTDPADHDAANPLVRQTLVRAIADAHPAFVFLSGDIAYRGDHAEDWKVWDTETERWRKDQLHVYPVLGNHDLKGNEATALQNYFARFPDLKRSRYYSLRAANVLILVLDSSLNEVAGEQGQWLQEKLDHLPDDIGFVAIMLHHPPYTSSSDEKKYGGGHSARTSEQALAKMLEDRQAHSRVRFVVFAGHVHNYERHEHNGVTYFVTGGGGAHAYPIERAPGDLFKSTEINYHYLLVDVTKDSMTISMHRLQIENGKEIWTVPDRVILAANEKSESAKRQ